MVLANSMIFFILCLWNMFRGKKHTILLVNPIQDGLFWGCSRMGGGQKGPHSLKSVTHPLMMKLDTVIPYLKKSQKLYESRDTPRGFC